MSIAFLSGCLDQNSATSSSPSDPNSSFFYKRLDGSTPIDGTENYILKCTDGIAGTWCESECISTAHPQYKRFTFANSHYEASGKCFVYLFAFSPQDGNLPQMKYYVGDYDTHMVSGTLKGYCNNISISLPDFDGFWAFTGTNTHEYLNWYTDATGTLSKSITLSVQSGDIFTYYDPDYSDNLTIQSVNGKTCLKESEITDSLIQATDI